jgi:hypothetical protein
MMRQQQFYSRYLFISEHLVEGFINFAYSMFLREFISGGFICIANAP